MRYLSLFSGISADSVAWRPLGWECVGFSEIDPFCNALLAHHYPSVPNLGDVSRITADDLAPLGSIDLIMFGFPCTDVSVTGQRKGLHNDDGSVTRSGLFYEAVRIIRIVRPRYFVCENVPGLRSNKRGRTFATVLSELTGLDIPPARFKWQNAGVVANDDPDGYSLAWRSLDAQYSGLAQRRERVFFVGYLGAAGWKAPAAVLFESESLSWHPAPSREKGQNVASTVNAGIGRRRGGGQLDNPLVARCDTTGNRYDFETENFVTVGCLTAGLAKRVYNQEVSQGHIIASTLRSGGNGRIPSSRGENLVFDENQITSKANRSNPQYGDPSHPLTTARPPTIAFSCKDNGRDASDLAPTLRAMNYDQSHINGGGQVAVAFDWQAAGGGNDTSFQGKSRRFIVRKDGLAGACSTSHVDAIQLNTMVRRLTVRECERLQGLEDDYTLVPYRGKMSTDSPRYKSIGNSIAIPDLRWIGERIEAVDAALASILGAGAHEGAG